MQNDLGYQRRLFDQSKARRWEDFNRIFSDFKQECFGIGILSDMFAALEARIKDLEEKDADYSVANV